MSTYPSAQRHPLQCFIPDFMQTNIAANVGQGQKQKDVLESLLVDHFFRNIRIDAAAQNRGAGQQDPLVKARRARRAARRRQFIPSICVCDAKQKRNLPGREVRCGDEPPTTDDAVNEAYDGLNATYEFYSIVYERDSIDNNGMPLNATVHFGKQYDNAFWDGERMIFGDGDNVLFNRFTIAIDVIGHELTHGVTDVEAGLRYFGQSGALNESISDVFGSLIKQYQLNQTANNADWLIGAGLLPNTIQRPDPSLPPALRSMKAPGTAYDDPILGKDPQPATMDDYVKTHQDNGGVHINSGIPNHAFYLAATYIGGFAWEKAGLIWYTALLDTNPKDQFSRFGRRTAKAAEDLFGVDSDEERAVRDAWEEVGVAIDRSSRGA